MVKYLPLTTNSTHVYSQFVVVGNSTHVLPICSSGVATNSTHVLPIRSSGGPQTVHMHSQFVVVGWPQTVHVSPVIHTVASCALLAQLVYIKTTTKNKLPLVLKTCNTLHHITFLQQISKLEKTTQALSVH